jgi:hypothetical protein
MQPVFFVFDEVFEFTYHSEFDCSDASNAPSSTSDGSSVADATPIKNPPAPQPPVLSHNWGPGQQLEHDEDDSAAQNLAGLFSWSTVSVIQ